MLLLTLDQDLSTRLAAVQSLQDAKRLLRESRAGSCPPDPLFALYDALLDDDAELRGIAAHVYTFAIATITGRGSPDIKSCSAPGPAADDLIQFLRDRQPRDVREAQSLVAACVSRILGPASLDIQSLWNAGCTPPSPRKLLQAALTEDHALFVEEKPNLYVDPVSEAERWASVLGGTGLENHLPVGTIGAWTTEGLDALLEQTEERMGGPLGWSSDPQVFEVGMRILILARFVSQKMQFTDKNVGAVPQDLGVQCQNKLQRLRRLGDERGGLHQIWRTYMARTIELLAKHE